MKTKIIVQRILFATLLAALTLPTQQAAAQNWLDVLKKGATKVVDDATGGKLTEAALFGTWTYARPSVRFEGGDQASDFSGSLVETLLVGQLEKVYVKGGIVAGEATLQFEKLQKRFTATFGRYTIGGTYAFDAATHAITFTVQHDGKTVATLTSHTYLSGGELTIVFEVKRLAELAREAGNLASQAATATQSGEAESITAALSLLSQYENAYLGFAFTK